MYISAPVPHICIALSVHFKDSEDTKTCIDFLENISTMKGDTKSGSLDDMFNKFIKRIDKEKNLIYYLSSFCSYYFQLTNVTEMFDLFSKLMEEYKEHCSMLEKNDIGYISGIFTTALMSDVLNNESTDKIPKDIQEAINYIESEQYIVNLMKVK